MFSTSQIIYAVLGIAAAALAINSLRGIWFWYKEGKKLQTSGYMTPASPFIARWTFLAVANLATRIFVGPLHKHGLANAKYEGRGLVLPNHICIWDFVTVKKAIPYGYRQLSKAAEIKQPVIATLAAWIGTVGVQVEGGKSQDGGGQAVIDTGAAILKASKGSRMLLFPQGKLVYTGAITPESFRTGATRMVQQAAADTQGEPLFIQPVALRYHRNKSEASWFQRIVYALGLGLIRKYRYTEKKLGADGQPVVVNGKEVWEKKSFTIYGASVYICPPIPVSELGGSPREAIEKVRLSIEAGLKKITPAGLAV